MPETDGMELRDRAECWEWPGRFGTHGYGVYGRNSLAHRLAWRLSRGSDPARGYVIRHRCDNRRCIRPQHLRLGTQRENVGDMWRNGRANFQNGHRPHGPAHHKYRRSPEFLRQVEVLAEAGLQQAAIGRLLGVSQTTIWKTLRG